MAKAVFDKAEALRRHREGEKVTDIAVDMGVSKTEVYNAIRELKRAEEWGAVKASDSAAAESGAVANADGVSGADNTEMPPEGKKLSEGVSVGEAAAEKPANKSKKNKDIRNAAKRAGVKLWEIAVKLGTTDQTLARKMRHELSECQKNRLINIINQISDEKKAGKPISKLEDEYDIIFKQDGQDIPEDSEEYADSVEEWAARKAAVSDIPKCYFIKLKDNSELTVYGVCEVIDKFAKVAFVGKSGKTVIVYAGELVYYCEKNDIDTLGDISVE